MRQSLAELIKSLTAYSTLLRNKVRGCREAFPGISVPKPLRSGAGRDGRKASPVTATATVRTRND